MPSIADRVERQVPGKAREACPACFPWSQDCGATMRSAITVSSTQTSTVSRKLRTMTATPIMIDNPTINADTVTAFRPGWRAAWSAAMSRRLPPSIIVLLSWRGRRMPNAWIQSGARQESAPKRQIVAR